MVLARLLTNLAVDYPNHLPRALLLWPDFSHKVKDPIDPIETPDWHTWHACSASCICESCSSVMLRSRSDTATRSLQMRTVIGAQHMPARIISQPGQRLNQPIRDVHRAMEPASQRN